MCCRIGWEQSVFSLFSSYIPFYSFLIYLHHLVRYSARVQRSIGIFAELLRGSAGRRKNGTGEALQVRKLNYISLR